MTESAFVIESLEDEDRPVCEAILRSLPEWFGIESAIREYLRDMPQLETYIARRDKEIIGFVSIERLDAAMAKIQVLAVRREFHRQGAGRTLVDHVQRELGKGGLTELEVHTRGPSQPDRGFARTRAFYAAMGFLPVAETLTIWGRENPCLIMRKFLAIDPTDPSSRVAQ